MKVILTGGYRITDEHAASSYGQAVLVNCLTGAVYGHGDFLKTTPWFKYELAKDVVRRLAKGKAYLTKEMRVIKAFTSML